MKISNKNLKIIASKKDLEINMLNKNLTNEHIR